MAHITTVNLSNDKWNETDAGLIAVGVLKTQVLHPWLKRSTLLQTGFFPKRSR